jgi:hypothetical protein
MPKVLGLLIGGILLVMGPLCVVFFEWLRYRTWRKHRHEHVPPATKHFSLIGAIGGLLIAIAAITVFALTRW